MNRYLKETKMLDYSNPNIQQLIENRKWLELQEFDRLKSIYNFVRDEILFGYNIDDNIPASKVLKRRFWAMQHKGYFAYGFAQSLQHSLSGTRIYD